ncbi:MAG: hypothetical protein AB1451_11155 [Nitrospirota bacterium]
MRATALPALLGALLAGHALLSVELASVRGAVAARGELAPPLPVVALKLLSLEYDSLIADLLFSRTLSFHGGQLNRRESINEDTYRIIYRRLDAASALDPYFVDPYYFGQAVLAWGANMPRETNALLDRGRIHRADDWVMPFFMGFNAFYFLRDDAQAAEYLMDASQRPGAAPLLGLLAARLASKGGTTEVAVVFLDQLAARTEDSVTRGQIRQRADALRGIRSLELAVEHYRDAFGEAPRDLRVLVERGVVPSLPVDPYGGTYYLRPDGSVWTTSDLRPVAR